MFEILPFDIPIYIQGKFLMNVLVGDLLHVADLTPDISGVDSVSTVTSMSGLGRKRVKE